MILNTRYGKLTVSDSDEVIGKYLKEYGEWAYLECSFLTQFVEHGNIIDVGAYIGTFSLAMHHLIPDLSRIDAFELNDDSFEILRLNTANKQKINVHNAYVGKRNRPQIYYKNTLNPGATSVKNTDNEHQTEVSIKAGVNLCNFVASNTELIKIDTEGTEAEIIATLEKCISKMESPTVYAEANDGKYTFEILTKGKMLGLNIFYFMFPAFNSDNYSKNNEDLNPYAYEAGLVFTNKSPELTDDLYQKGCRLYPIETHTDLKNCLWQTPRWGMSEWKDKDCVELVGILSKVYKWKQKTDYLMSKKELD